MALSAQDAWTFILYELGFILWILLNQQVTSKSTKEENWFISTLLYSCDISHIYSIS